MSIAPTRPDEPERLAALRGYGLLDTATDPAYDAFVSLVAHLCDVPIALVSLVDSQRQWFKANVGLPDVCETSRDVSFCAHALIGTDVFEIPDATLDARFADNPLVTGPPHVRFYAGMPLVDDAGYALGTLCALDVRPRVLTPRQRDGLRALAASLVSLIGARAGLAAPQLERLALVNGALAHAPNPLAILHIGEDRRHADFAYVNAAFERTFGYPAAEVIGKSPRTLHGPLTDEYEIDRLREAAWAWRSASTIVRLYAASGAVLTVEISDRPIDATHRILCYRDLTQIVAAREALETSHQRLASLLANNGDAVLAIEADGTCVDANVAAVRLFGRPRAALLGDGTARELGTGAFPDDERFPARLERGETMHYRRTFAPPGGRTIVASCKAVPMVVEGVTQGAYVIVKDETAEAALAQALATQAKRTRALYEISATNDNGVAQIDAALALVIDAFDMEFAYVGETAGALMTVRNMVGAAPFEVGASYPLARSLTALVLASDGVIAVDDLRAGDGTRFDGTNYGTWRAYIAAPLVVEGRGYGAIGFFSERTVTFSAFDRDFVRLVAVLVASALERRAQRERLDRLAFYDTLTGLSNRAKFSHDLDAAIAVARRHGRPFALHYIDLDGFKAVNDEFGHAAGDHALKETGRRLAEVTRHDDVSARLGGDEFVLLQNDVAGDGDAEDVGCGIVRALSQPYRIDDRDVMLGASVGVAIFPRDGDDARRIVRAADLALYRAKANGKRRCMLADPASDAAGAAVGA